MNSADNMVEILGFVVLRAEMVMLRSLKPRNVSGLIRPKCTCRVRAASNIRQATYVYVCMQTAEIVH